MNFGDYCLKNDKLLKQSTRQSQKLPQNFSLSPSCGGLPIIKIKQRKDLTSTKDYRYKKTHSIKSNSNSEIPLFEDLSPTKSSNSIDDYMVYSQIGRGAYATVKHGVSKLNGKRIAIKIYEKRRLISTQIRNCVKREMHVMNLLDHPNIVKLYDILETPKELSLIMEFVKGRSLFSYIKSKRGKRIEERECIKIFKGILEAIIYCHNQNVIHRDLKMENIILDENLNVKIIDFGFSTWFKPMQKLRIFCGTPSYMAPEIISKKEYYGPPSDMWSLGIMLYMTLRSEERRVGKECTS